MKDYLNHVIETIAAHSRDFEKAGLEPPQTIDIYMGQPNNPDDFEFTLPAVFIEYAADYDGETFDLILHVVQDFGTDTENFSPERTKGLEYITFLSVLKRCLYGLKMRPVFNPLRLYQETPMPPDFFFYHTLTFRCNFDTELYSEQSRYTDVSPVIPVLENGRLKDTMQGV